MKNNVKLYLGKSEEVLKEMKDNSVDTIITDPPYGLSFMGKKWDYDVPGVNLWKECLRVLKPGGTALIFAGSRTQHRMAVNVEDAGFILKDCIMWIYGSGFPKATDISKQLDKGHERKVIGKNPMVTGRTRPGGNVTNNFGAGTNDDLTAPTTPEAKLWNGWKSHGLKPAYEPIIVAIKPNDGTYANNALVHGVAGLNIDGGRIETNELKKQKVKGSNGGEAYGNYNLETEYTPNSQGRFPANIILDEEAGKMLDEQSGISQSNTKDCVDDVDSNVSTFGSSNKRKVTRHSDKGGASRFFYCAKASKAERNAGCEELDIKQSIGGGGTNNTEDDVCGKYGSIKSAGHNFHPTVKPLKLMEYLCTLTATPTGGIVLDPFMGSGTTGVACKLTGRSFIGIEMNEEYMKIAQARIKNVNQNKEEVK